MQPKYKIGKISEIWKVKLKTLIPKFLNFFRKKILFYLFFLLCFLFPVTNHRLLFLLLFSFTCSQIPTFLFFFPGTFSNFYGWEILGIEFFSLKWNQDMMRWIHIMPREPKFFVAGVNLILLIKCSLNLNVLLYVILMLS